jgi:DNA replication protein DnaC
MDDTQHTQHVSKLSRWARFETFGDPELEKMLCAAGQFCTAVKLGHSPRWLSLLGDSGTGKTHLAKRIWDWLCEYHRAGDFDLGTVVLDYSPRIIHWPSFVLDLRAGTEYERIRDMRRWPFLVLDEIGGERDNSGFAAEQLTTLVCCRTGRWTVLTSNLTLLELEKIDVRLASRMLRNGGAVIEVKAQDYSLRLQTPAQEQPDGFLE